VSGATTATIDRLHIITGTSADYNMTLPSAAANAGKCIGFLVRDYAAASKTYGLDAGVGVMIAGRTRYLYLTWENAVLLYSDGTRWLALVLIQDSSVVDLGGITLTGSVSNPTKGTRNPDKLMMQRRGSALHYRAHYYQTGTNGTTGSGDYRIDLTTHAIYFDGNIVYDGGTLSAHLHGPGIVGHGRIGNGSASEHCVPVYQYGAGNPPRVRVLGAAGSFWGSAFRPLNAACYLGLDICIPLI
jgi:hypothetical protein